MKKTKYSIQLPFFCGFYESPLLNSDSVYYEVKENLDMYQERYNDETLDEDDLELDYNAYTEACAEAFVDAFKYEMPSFITKMKFDTIVSPRYYNYSTDKICVNIEMDENWKEMICAWMKENEAWFKKRVKEDWSNRDGFISFLSNNYQDWFDEFAKEDENIDERYISAILKYMMYTADNRIYENLIYNVFDNVYISKYIYNSKVEDCAA